MSYEKQLMKDSRFWPSFWTMFSGALNDNVYKNALVILITFKAYTLLGIGSQQLVALCGGIFILPFFLFSALAGQIADKYPKHRLIFWIKVTEIIVMTVGALGFLFESIGLLLVVLFFMGLQSTFFGPIKHSMLPELVTDDELTQGNALVEMGTFVAILVGTILGGTLISLPSAGKFWISFGVIGFAIIGTLLSRKIRPLKAIKPDLKVEKGLIRPTWNMIKLAREVKGVWNSVLGISWFWFLGCALLSIFPIYVKDIVGGSEHIVSLFLALFSIGVATGSIVCEKFSNERLELGLVPIGSIGITLFMLDLYFIGMPFSSVKETITLLQFFQYGISWRIIVDLFFLSFFCGVFIVPLYTYVQSKTRPEARSRVIAANNVINALFMVVSSVFLAGLYSAGVMAHELYLIFAVLNVIIAVYIYTIIPEFMLRFCAMIIARMIYRIKVKGHDQIPEEGAAVLVCNHVSFIDWLIIAAAVKRPVRFVMHYSFFNMPIVGYLFRAAKVIPIAGAYENREILDKAFESIADELKDGELVCIFPEGKITGDGNLNPFKKGVEKIVSETPVPVISMALKGLWGSFFSRMYGRAFSRPSVMIKRVWSNVSLEIANPVPAQSVTAEKLSENVQQMLLE